MTEDRIFPVCQVTRNHAAESLRRIAALGEPHPLDDELRHRAYLIQCGEADDDIAVQRLAAARYENIEAVNKLRAAKGKWLLRHDLPLLEQIDLRNGVSPRG